MSNPNQPEGMQVDPSEGSIDEGGEQSAKASRPEGEGQDSARLEVDPSEGPTE